MERLIIRLIPVWNMSFTELWFKKVSIKMTRGEGVNFDVSFVTQ